MSSVRTLSLTLGPVLLVGLCYFIAGPNRSEGLTGALPTSGAAASGSHRGTVSIADCEQIAARLRQEFGDEFPLLIHPPFVIGGDLSMDDLERHYLDTIVPTARALSIDYFDTPPARPITILMFSGEEAYRAAASHLDGRQQTAYYGYYDRAQGRILLNLSTGDGTLAHELTHALAHHDFPRMPEWFDEGLASLHEESVFSPDGLRLIGQPNWRTTLLREASQQGELRPLESLLSRPYAQAEREALDYAHARGLCVYLQERQLLAPFYRKCRARIGDDPSGMAALREIFGGKSLAEIDTEFRHWLGGR